MYLYRAEEEAIAEAYFEDVNGQMGFMIALSMSAAFFSPTIAWIALAAVCLLVFAKGKAYRRVVDSYLYPNKNSKALFIAVTKLAPFMLGMGLLLMAALEIMTISAEHGLMFS